MTRQKLMQRLTSRELMEWQVYYGLEPFGQERDAAHAGMIASTVANFSGFRKDGLVYKPSDFMVDYARDRELSEEDQAKLQDMKTQQLHDFLSSLAKQSKGTVSG
jgi:hypothetical protein